MMFPFRLVEQSENPADEGEGEKVERGDVDFAFHG
jgi:hypothetical protein